MSLFQSGAFTLHSGASSDFKIDCDALTDADWAALAAWVAPSLPPFGDVVGVPEGGHAFARALRPYVTSGPSVLVDDVLTTGASMEQHRTSDNMRGLVLFARGEPPSWVRAIFSAERERTRIAEADAAALAEALPPAHRLRALAAWIDSKYPDDAEPQVQRDLRAWADAITEALRQYDQREVAG